MILIKPSITTCTIRSNQSYKSMDYAKFEFTIEWQTHHLDVKSRLRI